MEQQKILDISWATIFKIFTAIVVFYIFYSVRSILIWIIFALVISVLFNPAINFLQRRRIPRVIGAIAVYIGFFGFLSLVVYLIVPFFSNEIRLFIDTLPQYFERITPSLRGLGIYALEDTKSMLNLFGESLEKSAANIFTVLFTIFGGVFSGIFVITTAFFLSIEDKMIERGLILSFPKKYETEALRIWTRCQKKVAGWFGARIIACAFVGVASYIVLLVFNVQYPLSLALLSAVLNFIPYVGPFITGIILFLIILPANFMRALFVLISFILIQQVEGSILSPILMKKIIGLPPSLVLISLVIGGTLWGILGAILVIPLAGILFEFLREFLKKKKERGAVAL
jgi:predicted PurR-regulated permease PerM